MQRGIMFYFHWPRQNIFNVLCSHLFKYLLVNDPVGRLWIALQVSYKMNDIITLPCNKSAFLLPSNQKIIMQYWFRPEGSMFSARDNIARSCKIQNQNHISRDLGYKHT